MARASKLKVGDLEVSTLLQRPRGAFVLFVMAHGAGAPMTHVFMASMAEALAARGVATLRFNFPYTEAGKKRPDTPKLLAATIRAAVAAAGRSKLPLLVGGKSMGGRITSQCLAAAELPAARGAVFLGFPLHPAKHPATTRAAHLPEVALPMLFLQGTRDALAEPRLLRPLVRRLPSATLHEIAEADHSFAVPKRAGRDAEDVLEELADEIAAFARRVIC